VSDLQVDPVIGYRYFSIEGERLRGAHGGLWVPGKNTAYCDALRSGPTRKKKVWVNDPDDPDNVIQTIADNTMGHGRIPDPSCSCGFYAYWVAEGPGTTRATAFGGVAGDVLTKVRAWGRVLEGELGFRAECAEIVALISETPLSAADYYGVPILEPRVPDGTVGGWVNRGEVGEPTIVDVVTFGDEDSDGTYFADPALPLQAGARVRLQYELRGAVRWITDVRELGEGY
jgi:hypothetical protein